MSAFLSPGPGHPAPFFKARSTRNPRFTFDTSAGRYLVLCFFHDASDPAARAALDAAHARPDLFDDSFASFFGVSTTPTDESEARVTHRFPGYRQFWDFDLSLSRLYGAGNEAGERRGLWVLIDPTMRVIASLRFGPEGAGHQAALDLLAQQPPPERFAGIPLQAPVLYLPRVFEPELCTRLIDLFDETGGESSGFMTQENGRTVHKQDANHKVRRDISLSDQSLIATIQNRIATRVVPEIAKVHQFHVTRMERYIVSRYGADEGGHFRPHRDNTTSGTAHRRFAVSINLNDDFDGGEVSFPEYGKQSFKAPTGGAVVFSCSLLHAVSTVTRGSRYAFLPFLYDDAAAAIRNENAGLVGEAQG
ncbi:MAG: 2OG-Fe(II) oxygenase [Pseudomonadota bacterium]|nr:2OG-Fe(II) oxygenase [Pseudomonadota bacterium]